MSRGKWIWQEMKKEEKQSNYKRSLGDIREEYKENNKPEPGKKRAYFEEEYQNSNIKKKGRL